MTVVPATAPSAAPRPPRVPRQIHRNVEPADRIFFGSARGIGALVLVLTSAIGIFLGVQAIPTLKAYGWSFFTTQTWNPELNKIGIAAVLVGTIEVALVAMVVSFPLATGMALFITEYCPRRIKAWLVSAVDLMAAVPSIIYGLWGFSLLMPHAESVERFMSQHFSWIPIFAVNGDPNAPVWLSRNYTSSAFIAGLAVSMMAIPLACSVMRAVFDQTPIGEREAAMALGGTRFGVIRKVVLPFGKGGVIGGSMLALGRSLGETAACLIILAPAYQISLHIFEPGAQTTSALIAGDFGQSTHAQLEALLTAGFVLFLITLIVNSVAATIIGRSRSGAGTDI